jgi:hypothetical protein
MKKYLLFIYFTITISFVHAQFFDDLPFPRPDSMTYFQQEMTSLMRFQIEHNVDIPFFISISQLSSGFYYNENEIKSFIPNFTRPFLNKAADGSNFLANSLPGFQFKINSTFSIPVFLFLGQSNFIDYCDEGAWVDNEYRMTYLFYDSLLLFLGSGLVINTDIFKGGIYAGVDYSYEGFSRRAAGVTSVGGDNIIEEKGSFMSDYIPLKFKIAFLLVINTSTWQYVGKVLNYFMGFIGLGETVYA